MNYWYSDNTNTAGSPTLTYQGFVPMPLYRVPPMITTVHRLRELRAVQARRTQTLRAQRRRSIDHEMVRRVNEQRRVGRAWTMARRRGRG